MIMLASMPILRAKVKDDVNIAGIVKGKFYVVVGSVVKQLPDKETKEKKNHDQIVLISDNGTWIEIYPGRCIFELLSPFKE